MAVLFFRHALLPDGWARNLRMLTEAGTIVSLEPDASPMPGDERHELGLPGMPNLHSHAFQRAMAGLTQVRGPASDNFWTWRDVMYRFVGVLGPEDVQAIAAQLFVEMLESGFTRVGEFHYLHHDPAGAPYANLGEMAERIAAAAQDTQIGLTLLPAFYAHSGFGGREPEPGQRRFVNDVDRFKRLMEASRAAVAGIDGAVIGVAPHSLRAVTPEELARVVPMADGGPVHIHVAEQTREVDDCLAWSGARPLSWLLDNAAVDHRWCIVHATHATPVEIDRMARRGAVAGLCPVTEADLGDGTFAAPEFIAAGGRYGVGSDSNVRVGVADELRQLEYSQRLSRRERNVVALTEGRSTGRALYDGACRGGSQALGSVAAGLAAGAEADIVSLDISHEAFAGRSGDAVLDAWIFSAPADVVDCVWRRGRKVVAGGRHTDHDAVAARFRRTMERLLAR